MKKPDIEGRAGKAWRYALPKPETIPPAEAATIGAMLIHQPGVRAAWSNWFGWVFHLRDIPGTPAPTKDNPSVTHQITVVALNPDFPPPDPDKVLTEFPKWLSPPDQQVQFEVPTDAAAVEVFEMMFEACCLGVGAADSDFRHWWKLQVEHQAAHERGEHGEPPKVQ